jgi:acyl-CoA dehydrogenase
VQLLGPGHRQHGGAAPVRHPEQKDRWLTPLLDGEIRSAFAMTEPDVASSDATNIALRIERDGEEYVLNGRKWWTSNALHPHCRIMIVMGKTQPDGPATASRARSSCRSTPRRDRRAQPAGVRLQDQEGHAEVDFEDVRVPAANLIAARATAS